MCIKSEFIGPCLHRFNERFRELLSKNDWRFKLNYNFNCWWQEKLHNYRKCEHLYQWYSQCFYYSMNWSDLISSKKKNHRTRKNGKKAKKKHQRMRVTFIDCSDRNLTMINTSAVYYYGCVRHLGIYHAHLQFDGPFGCNCIDTNRKGKERERNTRARCFLCQRCQFISCFLHFLSYIKMIKVNFSIYSFYSVLRRFNKYSSK